VASHHLSAPHRPGLPLLLDRPAHSAVSPLTPNLRPPRPTAPLAGADLVVAVASTWSCL
jgi:hypothetical protein